MVCLPLSPPLIVPQLYAVFLATNASIAPAPAQHPPSRRTELPSMPPKAKGLAGHIARANLPSPMMPRGRAPGWLRVAKTGEQNRMEALARRARIASAWLCTEAVINPRRGSDKPPCRQPPRKCTPACSCAASRASPATTSAIRRALHNFASFAPSAARSGTASCRNTTPHRPGGRRATRAQRSVVRSGSVNSHSGGNAENRFTLRAQLTNA